MILVTLDMIFQQSINQIKDSNSELLFRKIIRLNRIVLKNRVIQKKLTKRHMELCSNRYDIVMKKERKLIELEWKRNESRRKCLICKIRELTKIFLRFPNNHTADRLIVDNTLSKRQKKVLIFLERIKRFSSDKELSWGYAPIRIEDIIYHNIHSEQDYDETEFMIELISKETKIIDYYIKNIRILF